MNLLQRLLANSLPTATAQPPTPDATAVAEDFKQTRLYGRRGPSLTDMLRRNAHEAGQVWPIVISDEETGTMSVPTSYEGLLALVARWDSLLLDEELVSLRNLVMGMVPMGVLSQTEVRKKRAQDEEGWDHMRTHHPDTYDKIQGPKV